MKLFFPPCMFVEIHKLKSDMKYIESKHGVQICCDEMQPSNQFYLIDDDEKKFYCDIPMGSLMNYFLLLSYIKSDIFGFRLGLSSGTFYIFYKNPGKYRVGPLRLIDTFVNIVKNHMHVKINHQNETQKEKKWVDLCNKLHTFAPINHIFRYKIKSIIYIRKIIERLKIRSKWKSKIKMKADDNKQLTLSQKLVDIADPFIVEHDTNLIVIYEKFPSKDSQAHLEILKLDKEFNVKLKRKILFDFHVSFPFCILKDEILYIYPECIENQTQVIIKLDAENFTITEIIKTKVPALVDASVVTINDKLYYLGTGDIGSIHCDTSSELWVYEVGDLRFGNSKFLGIHEINFNQTRGGGSTTTEGGIVRRIIQKSDYRSYGDSVAEIQFTFTERGGYHVLSDSSYCSKAKTHHRCETDNYYAYDYKD